MCTYEVFRLGGVLFFPFFGWKEKEIDFFTPLAIIILGRRFEFLCYT